MLLTNLDVESGLVNGSIGIIKTISLTLKGAYIDVAFIIRSGIRLVRLTPVKECHDGYSLWQFPIVSSYATSVHKVQGMTIDSIVVGDIRNFWCSQQLYVALSRVKSINDIKFLQPDDRPLGFTLEDLREQGKKRGKIEDAIFNYGLRFDF